MCRKRTVLGDLGCLLLLLGLHLTLGVYAAGRVGLTTDEMTHLAAGRLAAVGRDYRLDPIHPPLARLWIALGGLDRPSLRPRDLGWNRFVPAVHAWIHRTGNARAVVFVPRVLNLAWTASLIVALWIVLRRYGRHAAALGAGAAALSPHLLAHGSLATTDAALIASFTWATLALARLSRCVSPLRLAVAALAVAVCVTVKFSGLVILPTAVLIAAVRAWTALPVHWRLGRPRVLCARGRKALALGGALLAVGAFAWLSVWAVYGLRFSAGPAGAQLGADFWQVPPERRGAAALFEGAREARVLPEAYLYGLTTLALREGAREAYFLGQHKQAGGWWSYFPVALLVKTPGMTLLLIATGCGAAVVHWWRRRRCVGGSDVWPAAIAATTFGVVAMAGRMNIGVRHVLPVLPLAFLIAVPGVAALLRRPRRGVVPVAAVLCWLVVVDLSTAPNFLCYFNRLAREPGGGAALLADSNIDWGQGLPELAAYQRRTDDRPVHLFYLGMDRPEDYGIAVVPPSRLGPGRFVVSINYLAGLRLRWSDADEARYRRFVEARSPRLAEAARERLLARLASGALEPDGRIGCSLAFFDLDRDELERLLE